MTHPPQKQKRAEGADTGALRPPSLAELRRELEEFERETEERRPFRTEMKDLREGLSERKLRERLGPFLVRVEKFATQFIRSPGDAELGRSLFTPWISLLVGSAADPGWRIPGGFDVLQRWCWSRYRAEDKRLWTERASLASSEAPGPASAP
jgi:hypothetical protein